MILLICWHAPDFYKVTIIANFIEANGLHRFVFWIGWHTIRKIVFLALDTLHSCDSLLYMAALITKCPYHATFHFNCVHSYWQYREILVSRVAKSVILLRDTVRRYQSCRATWKISLLCLSVAVYCFFLFGWCNVGCYVFLCFIILIIYIYWFLCCFFCTSISLFISIAYTFVWWSLVSYYYI